MTEDRRRHFENTITDLQADIASWQEQIRLAETLITDLRQRGGLAVETPPTPAPSSSPTIGRRGRPKSGGRKDADAAALRAKKAAQMRERRARLKEKAAAESAPDAEPSVSAELREKYTAIKRTNSSDARLSADTTLGRGERV
jgi:hypothetical protein